MGQKVYNGCPLQQEIHGNNPDKRARIEEPQILILDTGGLPEPVVRGKRHQTRDYPTPSRIPQKNVLYGIEKPLALDVQL